MKRNDLKGINHPISQYDLKRLLSYNRLTGVFTYKLTSRSDLIGKAAGSDNGCGYIKITVDGVSYYAHRLAWLYVYGEWPKDEIDHIHRNPSNNRIKELRESTSSQNKINTKTRIDNTSGCRGVNWNMCHKRWVARIHLGKKEISLGKFTNKSLAVKARHEAEKKYFL